MANSSQWTSEELAVMLAVSRPAFQFNRIQKDANVLFTDISGGFIFTTHFWKEREAGYKWRFRESAIAHRDEACCRRMACLLESRKVEAAHWQACQRFLENLFQIPEITDGSSADSSKTEG